MKRYIYTLAAFLLSGLFSTGVSAQDIIKQKNGEELEVRIVELADDYVIYYHFEDPNEVQVKMNRSLIREVEFEYGRKETEVTPGADESYYVDDKRNNLKLNFSAIANTASILTYERAIDSKSSWEASIAAHGLGVNNEEERSGFGMNAAYKLKFGGLFKKDDYRPAHLLHGGYLRPNLGFNSISFDNPTWLFDEYEKYSYLHGGFDIGKEWILNNTLSLDLYGGFHYYGGTFTQIDNPSCESCETYEDINDGNLSGSSNVAAKYGLQIGFLF